MTKGKELQVTEKQAITQSEGEPTREGVMWVPQVDIVESPEAITLFADLPGVRKEDVDIDVRDGVLTLTATVAPPQSGWRPVYSEYQVGGFTRRFNLSDRIDPSKIDAQMKSGVLTLMLPKAAEHKPRKITIR